MAINLNKANAKKGVVIAVIGFGVIYTALQIWFLSTVKLGTGGTFIVSAIGATVLQYFFWPKYIGSETLYRARPIWIPLIVGAAIVIPFIVAMVIAGA